MQIAYRMVLANLFLVGVFTGFLFGCPGAAKTALDVTDAVCEVLGQDLQDEPDFIKFGCNAVETVHGDTTDAGDAGTPTRFVVKVPKTQAKAFAAQYCK